jgi:hypothetical protein
MRKALILAMALSLSKIFITHAQPATEIFLGDLSQKKGKMVISHVVNISQHKGYDNQPFFHPSKSFLYYATANDSGRTDIMRYDLVQNESKRITTTHDREYSPTVTPDKNHLSCILQKDDGSQDLVQYPIDGGKPETLIDGVKIGYHVWLNDHEIFAFVLGDTMTLRRYDLKNKNNILIAKSIGRSLHKIPGEEAISFVDKSLKGQWTIKQVQKDGTIKSLAPTLPEQEDLCWTPDAKIVMSNGPRIFIYDPKKGSGWEEVEIQSAAPLPIISRVAISSDGKKIAFVGNE